MHNEYEQKALDMHNKRIRRTCKTILDVERDSNAVAGTLLSMYDTKQLLTLSTISKKDVTSLLKRDLALLISEGFEKGLRDRVIENQYILDGHVRPENEGYKHHMDSGESQNVH